jgi:DNA-binding FrmR family transcriptional regulator
MVGYSENREQHLVRLRRIEGQVRGLQRMVEADDYCIDVLTQIASVTKALQKVGLGLLDEHVHHCVMEAAGSSEGEGEAKVQEAVDAVARLLRS